MARTKEIKLGQLLVQHRWCTLQQVNKALLLQRQLRAESKSIPLGALLLEAGAVAEENLRRALAELGVLRLNCPQCRISYTVEYYQSEAESTCPSCHGKTLLDNSFGNPSPESTRVLTEEELSREYQAQGADPDGSRPLSPTPSPRPGAPQKDTCLGRVLGGCEITEKIAHGGMGVVYRAKQLNLGRIVAVKVLSEEFASDETFVRRFMQEARAAAHLNHGNIVHINDVGECQGTYYFVMEYVDGENLREILKREKALEISWALDIAIQVCHALRHAHSRGVVHRDIKPENIMLTREKAVKLADLGLAKRLGADLMPGVTHSGSILGTPFYMAPEQAKDFSRVDGRSDIYSLGVTLYRMITGKVPYSGRTPIEVMIKAIEGRKMPMHELRNEVPLSVEEVVDRMMHRDPEERYQNVEEVLVALQGLREVVREPQRAP